MKSTLNFALNDLKISIANAEEKNILLLKVKWLVRFIRKWWNQVWNWGLKGVKFFCWIILFCLYHWHHLFTRCYLVKIFPFLHLLLKTFSTLLKNKHSKNYNDNDYNNVEASQSHLNPKAVLICTLNNYYKHHYCYYHGLQLIIVRQEWIKFCNFHSQFILKIKFNSRRTPSPYS